MSPIAEEMVRNQRLIILRALAGTNDGRLNETMLGRELDHFGHRLAQDVIRSLLRSLEERAAILTEMAGGVIMIAEITQRGEDHLDRRGTPLEGVAVPGRR